jgi:hypothetical protein
MTIAGLRCACGDKRLAAVSPGTEGDNFASIALRRPVPPRAWCRSCWTLRFGRVSEAAPQRAAR